MPLTPAEVHNVAFKKPPIGKRGYDEEEVDAFLYEVERELARLIEENNELRAQLERGARRCRRGSARRGGAARAGRRPSGRPGCRPAARLRAGRGQVAARPGPAGE